QTSKCGYVGGTPADLPWRYTPVPLDVAYLRPWLVLVVGTPAEVAPEPDGRVSLAGTLTADYVLAKSTRWAHIQDDGAHRVGRVLSERQLLGDRDYLAALVPAFAANGDDAWLPGAGVTVPCFAL